jgi:hypothetical protein
MRDVNVLLIGHSHTRAMFEASREYPHPRLSFELLDLFNDAYWTADGSLTLEVIRQDALGAGVNASAVLLCLWGNEPNALTLIEAERPFDFLLPGRESDELMPGSEIIPAGLVRRTLESLTVPGLYELFSDLFECPVYVVSTPPPIEDADYIARHPGTAAERLKGRTIGPAKLRLKVWRLYCQLVRHWATDAGFRFVEVPAANVNERGFLHEKALSGDATHGNIWYGRNMIDHLAKVICGDG